MNNAEKLQRIQDLLKLHNTRGARPLIDELIHAEPSNIEVWYWRGVCKTFDEELDSAQNDFLNVIRQKTNHDRAFYGLAVVLEHKGKLKDAIAAYKQAASLGNKEAQKKLTQYGSSPYSEDRKLPQNVVDHGMKPTVELKTERGIDYTRLRELLVAGQWKEADQETEKLMCQAGGKNKNRWGKTFPCNDLKTIDNLWTYYSQGRFGFSVQKEIWQRRCDGGKKFNRIIWDRFASSVGWLDKGLWSTKADLSFDEAAPRGHLPVGMWAPQKSGGFFEWWLWGPNRENMPKFRSIKSKKYEARWNGVVLIDILSRLESCKSEIFDGIEKSSFTTANQSNTFQKKSISFWKLIRLVIGIFLPPLAVLLTYGLCMTLLINVLLTLLGWIPGIIHAMWAIAKHE